MLTYGQRRNGVMGAVRGFARRLRTWWLSMTDEQQTVVRMRGVALAGCAVMVSVGLPAISSSYTEHRLDAEHRATALRFAEADSPRDALDPANLPSLIDHPWMVAVEYALDRSPEDALTRYGQRYRDAAAVSQVASFEPRHLDKAEETKAAHKCLSEAIYYEARSETKIGQLAVAEVIMNRVSDHRYPDSICEVVFQGSERRTGCQFSFTCDGSMSEKPYGESWKDAQTIAMHVLLELNEPITGGATHYHTDYVNPVWNSGLIKTEVYGAHIFYPFPRGAEWSLVRDRQERRVRATMIKASADRAIVPAAEAAPKTTSVIKSAEAAPAP